MRSIVKKLTAWMLVLILMCAGVCTVSESMDLPKTLQIIGEQAFEGLSSVKKIVFPDDTRRIESRAFANSSLEEVYLPDSVEYIAEDAFEGCENLMFFVPRGSYAHERLYDMNAQYTIIESENEETDVYAIHRAEYFSEEDETGAVSAGFIVVALKRRSLGKRLCRHGE